MGTLRKQFDVLAMKAGAVRVAKQTAPQSALEFPIGDCEVLR
jgi:hypothetical protein